MSTSQSYDESSSSASSRYDEMSDFEVEVEEFDSLSDRSFGSAERNANVLQANEAALAGLAILEPYDGEPIADEEWVKEYEEKKENKTAKVNALRDRLDENVPVKDWCKCGNCGLDFVQNVYETQCCQEIEKCVLALSSADVLADTEDVVPPCITKHPGFQVTCLEKWTLKLAASNYKKKDRRKYRQCGAQNVNMFLRSVAYRQFVQLVYGKLGKLRIPLPSCVYQAIRAEFKSDKGFTGFVEEFSDSD